MLPDLVSSLHGSDQQGFDSCFTFICYSSLVHGGDSTKNTLFLSEFKYP